MNSPVNVERLRREMFVRPLSPGLGRLQVTHDAEVRRRTEVAQAESVKRSEADRRGALFAAADHALGIISAALKDAIPAAAPTTELVSHSGSSWELRLRDAQLRLMTAGQRLPHAWGNPSSVRFDVISSTGLELEIPQDQSGYKGRGHSLWYGDIQQKSQYQWFETAFMLSPLLGRHSPIVPFARDPGPEAAEACGPGIGEYQVAWPFAPLAGPELESFIDRWAGWFAAAADGELAQPSNLPERPPSGSWRTS